MATAATETVVKDDVFLPDATDSSKSKTSRADDDSASSSSPVQPLKIPFAPGDHITRWEMLPIAWPIQVHGIVLEVHSDSVLLVDFGLAAALDPAEEKDGGDDDDDEEQEENKKQHRVKSAIESFQKSLRKKERQRLNVRTLTEQKDISKWSKVNYDGGLFGFGDGEKQEDSNAAEKTKNEKKDYWWKKWKKIQTQKNAVKEKQERAEQEVSHVGSTPDVVDKQGKIAQSKTDTNDSEESSKLHVKSDEKISWWGLFSRQSHKKEAVEECSSDDDLMDILQEVGSHENAKENDIDLVWELERRIMRKQLGVVNVAQKASADTDESHPEPEDPNKRKEQNDDTEQSDNDTEQEKQKDGAASNVNTSAIPDGSIRDNPIDTTTAQGDVKNDSEEKKDEKVADIENDDKVAPKATVEENKESTESTHMRKLSRADPPTLVLARTNWLLQHGESILPPYHAFSSNSECMAVFCKTGYWSTLQADIFLHSTAIGNAKSTVVMTLAVAASVPVMAPVAGLAGLGAIAAPWLYLSKHKNAAEETQHKLTDSFWQQAEPEVFIECIREWSHLGEYESSVVVNEDNNNDGIGAKDNGGDLVEGDPDEKAGTGSAE